MRNKSFWLIVILFVAGLALSACARNATTTEKPKHFQLEEVQGSDFKRVILTEKAAERLGIETTQVREEQIFRKRIVGGKVITSQSLKMGEVVSTPVSTSQPSSGGAPTKWVRISLNQSDLDKVDQSQPARILPFQDDDEEDEDEQDGWTAEADEGPGDDDSEETALYYTSGEVDQALDEGRLVRVELPLKGGGSVQKVIPYAAVIYGINGETWVYINPETLVYVRYPISVDYIEGDQAILLEGPPAGTPVVVVGAAELYGAESGVGGH